MKKLNRIAALVLGSVVATSCVDMNTDEFTVDKPVSVENQEEIDAYNAIKTYADEAGIKLGAGIEMSDYLDQGVPFRIVNQNFNEVTLSSGMHHGDIVNESGNLGTGSVENFFTLANDAGVSVYGSALAWHNNQNGVFLNSTIAPEEGGPPWIVLGSQDFETDDASNYQANGENAVLSFTADGEGANGEGRALVVGNSEVRADDWRSQLFFTFSEPTEEGESYRLTMDVKADEAATMATQAQTGPGQYQHFNFFGQISATTEWQTITVEIVAAVGASSDETVGVNTIAFNLGNTATNYYFDNIEVAKFNPDAGGPTWDLLDGNDFETDDASNYQPNGENAVVSFTADGEGYDGVGRALVVENAEVRADDWRSQLFFTFGTPTVEGQQYRLIMDVKADDPATMATQAQTAPGAYQHFNFFGQINATTEWNHIEVTITAAVGAGSDETVGVNTIAFNLGNTATSYYFDNIEVRWLNEEGGGLEKTPEEKADTLSYHFDKWIAGMMEVSKETVNAWDVVKEPLDDANPTELRSGLGNDELPDNVFYWQDYLGKDYAVTAFNLARQYGNEGDLLFINESNLENNLAKVQGLVDFIDYIETNGASVDGISTQMHIAVDSDKDMISEMFQLLGNTDKMIKIGELNVALNAQPTEELYMMQAEMYKYVLDQYIEHISASNRYGITIWGPIDEADGNILRQGLWDPQFVRKPAYAWLVESLMGGL